MRNNKKEMTAAIVGDDDDCQTKAKKGQELTLGTIIEIILGITVLTLLIYGFSYGWQNMWCDSFGCEYRITNPTGNDSEYLINIIDCSSYLPLNSTDFLVPLEYVESGRQFGERINETHGQMCWYDVLYIDDLNDTWLNEECWNENYEYFLCDKGFIVT